MKRHTALTTAALVAVTTLLANRAELSAQERCDFRDELSAELDVRGGDRLDVEAGSGLLVVEGEAGASRVRVTAVACASTADALQSLDMTLARTGSEVQLRTEYPEWDGWSGGGERYARLDLRIEVPSGMDVTIQDGSGSMELAGLGAVDVDDGSGHVRIDRSESVRIEDGSGNVDLIDIAGSIEVHDGSGAIVIESAGGPVELWDGSGSIRVFDAEDDVHVRDDGSGGIDVDGVAGDFTVDRGRAQGIEYRNVRGQVDVPVDRRRRRRPGG